jgi:CBS domain-containing protein
MRTSLSVVKNYMKKHPVTIHADMEVQEVVVFLLDHHISAAPVVDEGGKLVGIVAERDCLEAFLNAEYYQSPTTLVSDVMSSQVVTVDSDADVLKAARLFSQHKFHHLPVLAGQRLVGDISRREVIRAILDTHQKSKRRWTSSLVH